MSTTPPSSSVPTTTTNTKIAPPQAATQSPATRSLTPLHSHPYPPPPPPPPHHHLYPSQSVHLRPPSATVQPHNQHHDQSPHSVLYPVASSGRGFISKSLRPEHTVTIANPGAYPSRSLLSYHRPPTPTSTPSHLDPSNHPAHFLRPPHHHLQHHPNVGAVASGPIKGIPVSLHPKVASSPSSYDSNGYKNLRDRINDDTLISVRERKVRITDGASLYALCRSWLRNGFPEESQPQDWDIAKSLPRPLPIPVTDNLRKRKEDDEQNREEEDGESVEHLSAQDLLKRHIKRAKQVRARLREERLKRIARYKTRLALLLPPLVEQFRSDAAAGN